MEGESELSQDDEALLIPLMPQKCLPQNCLDCNESVLYYLRVSHLAIVLYCKVNGVSVFRISPSCRSVRQENELILLNTDTGKYYGLNITGSFIWEMLVSGIDRSEISDRYCREFAVSAEIASNDVHKVVSALKEQGLLVEV